MGFFCFLIQSRYYNVGNRRPTNFNSGNFQNYTCLYFAIQHTVNHISVI